MTDRKTIIKGVECCSRPNNTNLCGECPYNKIETRFGCMHRLITDVFAILKEQEAIEPISYHRSDGTIFKYECRQCRTKIFKMDLFCRHCGQKVKWNE